MKLILSATFILVSISAYSNTTSDLDYPELMVTPRASERLAIEASKEKSMSWYKEHLPMITSASATLLAGILQFSGSDETKDPDNKSAIAGLIVGGSWLAIDIYIAGYYNAYLNAYRSIKTIPSKNRRQKLIKERLAEEEINRLCRLGSKLKWISIVTNAAAGGYMISKAKSDSTAIATSALSVAAALGPLIFSNRWIDVAKEQREYKKKIYAPIVRSTIFADPKTGKPIPGAIVSMSF